MDLNTKTGMKSDRYWATLQGEEFLSAAQGKITKFYDYIQTSGLYDVWDRAFVARYGGDLNEVNSIFESTRLSKKGSLGQITSVKVNHYKNLVKHAINLAVANKTSLSCVATNLDKKSQGQTLIGNSVLEYYLRVKKMNQLRRDTVESGCLFGEGWIHCPWDQSKGELYQPPYSEDDQDETSPTFGMERKKSREPEFTGDIDPKHFMPHNVIRDISKKDTNFKWLIIRDSKNIYDLIADHPDKKDDILAETDYSRDSFEDFRLQVTNIDASEDSDEIPYYYFYLEPCKAAPAGRVVEFSKSIIYYDNALPYESMPVLKFMPEILRESCFGYSPFNDLLGIQQGIDNLSSTLMSNNMTFGKQHVWNKKGDVISTKDIEGGLRFIYSNNMPEALNLTKSSPESYKFLEMLEKWAETLSGISSTVRGSPESNLKSGNALALVVAQAVQFGSDLEEAANALLEDFGTTIIEHLKSFAKTPRVTEVVGEFNKPYVKDFSASDLSDIKRTTVEQTNAMAKTIAGRVEIAGQVMEMPPDKAKIYMSILNTGKLPEEMKTHSELINIRAENEALKRGEDVQVIISENHINHFLGHKEELENPENKKDPELVQRILNHLMQHIEAWRNMDPAMAQMIGLPPAPPIPMGPNSNQSFNPMGQERPGGQPMEASPSMQMPSPAGPMQDNLPNMPKVPGATDPNSAAAYEQFQNNIANI